MPTLTARDWTVAAATRLASHGADQVRIEPLAEHLGVSKGSFYWHFAHRDALLSSVLDLWEERGTEAIIAQLEAEQPDSQARLRALVHHTFGQPAHDGIELGIRAWAVRDERAREVAARVDARRIEYVAGLIQECGLTSAEALTRSHLMYRTLIGEFVLRSHGHPRLGEHELDHLAGTLTLTADAPAGPRR